jgi:hypothetical protein
MKRWIACAVAAGTAALLAAQEPAAAVAKMPDPAKAEFSTLEADFEAAQKAYAARVRELQQTDEYKAALEASDREALTKLISTVEKIDLPAFAKRAWEGAERYAAHDNAVPFLVWIAINDPDREATGKAVDTLLSAHVQSAELLPLAENAIRLNAKLGPERSAEVLQQLVDAETTDLVKAHALFLQATMLQRGRDATAEQKAAAEALLARAEKLAVGTDLAMRIEGPRFEQARLQIGMEAPDVEGVDLDGSPFKLSDYRGKVVVLDFWGDW